MFVDEDDGTETSTGEKELPFIDFYHHLRSDIHDYFKFIVCEQSFINIGNSPLGVVCFIHKMYITIFIKISKASSLFSPIHILSYLSEGPTFWDLI